MADKNFSSKGSFRKLQNELKKSFEETIKKASTEAFDDVEIEGEVDGKKVKVKGSAIKNEVQKQLAKNLEEVTISPTVNIEPEFKMAKGADKKVESLVKDIASNTVIAPKVDLSKAINSFEDLKAIVSEFEEVYNRIQRGTLRRQDPTYIGDELKTSFRDIISDDYRDTVDWDIKDEGLLDKQKEKLLEIYKLYKNIQSAIKNNKGFYKGEQYDTSDLKDLEKVFKSYAQAYYEMSLEIQDADKRINEELAMDGFTSNMSEEVESLESVTSKMTKQFKGYVQEVIENSDAVRKNNTAYKEEQKQLQESNALLKERAQLLRNKILDTVKNKRGEDAYDKARYALPYLYDDYDMYDDWGVDSWRDEKIDVLKEVAEALGVEIPQAAEKAKESLKEISQTEDVSDVATPISEELEKENSKAEEVLETFKKIKAYLDGIESDEHSDLYGFQDLKGKDFNAIFNAFKNFDFDLLKEIGFSEEEINESRVAFERIIAEVKETQSLGRKVKNQDKWDAYESEFGQPPEVRVIDLADDWLNVVDKLINKIQELGTTEKETFQEIPKYVQKSEDEIYESALKLAQNEEGIFEEIAQQEINLANKTSGETKKAYAEMATATYKMFKEGAYESEIEDKIRSTDVLIKELQGRIEAETEPEVILSLNEQLDEAKIKILALQEVFKDIRPKGVFDTSGFEDRDVLEKYSRKHRENYTIGQSNYSIASEDREYWQTLTKGISSEKELTDAIVKRKEEMVALTMEMSKAEDQEHALMNARDALPYGEERDAATAAYDEAFDHTQALTEKYNEIRQELYNLIQLQNNWGKSIQDASEINSVFMYSEWREEEQALYPISDEIEAIAKSRLQDAEAARQEANEIKNEIKVQEENTKAARKRLTEQARYYLNKANEGKIDYSETEAQFNRIISEMQQLGESTAHVEEQFAKAKAAFNMDGVAEGAEKGAEKIEAEAESFSENAEKAQEAAQAKGKFNEANKETQQEADKSADKVKEETEAVDEATLAFDGYYKNQRNKVGDDSWGYTEKIGYAQDKFVNISHDQNGNIRVSEELRTNYQLLEKEIKKVTEAAVTLKGKTDEFSRKGVDTSASRRKLEQLGSYLHELNEELQNYYNSAEYVPSSHQKETFAQELKNAISFQKDSIEQKVAAQAKTVGVKSDLDALKASDSLYDKLKKNIKEVYDLKKKNASFDADSAKDQTQQKANNDKINSLLLEQSEIRKEILAADATQISREEEITKLHKEQNAELNAAIQKNAGDQYDKLFSGVGTYLNKINQVNIGKSTQQYKDQFKPWKNDLESIQYELEKIKNNGLDVLDPTEIYNLVTAFNVLKDSIDKALGEKSLSKNKEAAQSSLNKLKKSIDDIEMRNSAMGASFRAEFENLRLKIDTADSNEEVEKLKAQIIDLESRLIRSGKTGKSVFQQFGEAVRTSSRQFLAQYFSLQDFIRYAREGFDTVVQVDSALTELRKVSDASDERLAMNFEKSTETAKELGSTISDVIGVTADWARLGYDVDAAEDLARVTTLFQTVGDNMTAEETSSYLISTLQGFQMATSQAEEIADKYNEVANNFAIDTKGIGEALQRSAASFNAANTDLSEAIALVTTTNTVVQDPSSVGTLWKTMSARVRGAKAELIELGEEEDTIIESTSKLRDMVKGMTGFDIMEDEDTFKSIYDIILGIGKEWDKLSDIDQAALGEALAGKRNANALFAVLNNIETLEKAYATAEDAQGSAQREQENYAKSIEYSIGRMKAAAQEFWATFIESGTAKKAVDLLTNLLNLLTDITKATHGIATVGGVGLLGLLGHKPELIESMFATIADKLGLITPLSNQAAGGFAKLGASINVTKTAVLTLIKSPLAPWVVGATIAVTALAVAWDKMTTTVSEVQSELDKTSGKISTLKSEIKELQDIDYRTNEQEKRLENLEKELEFQEKIYNIEQKRLVKEKYGSKFEDYFDKDNYNSQLLAETNRQNPDSIYRQLDLINKYQKKLDNKSNLRSGYESWLNSGNLTPEEIEYYNLQINDLSSEIDELNGKNLSIVDELQDKANDFKSIIEEGQEALDNGLVVGSDKVDVQNTINEYQKLYDAIHEKIDPILKENGLFDYSSTINSVFEHVEFDGLKNKLVDMAKEGSLSIDSLTNYINGKDGLSEALEAAGVDVEDLYKYILQLSGLIDRENLVRKIAGSNDYFDDRGFKTKAGEINDYISSLTEEEVQIVAGLDIDWSTFNADQAIAKMQAEIKKAHGNPVEVDVEFNVSKFNEQDNDLESLQSLYDSFRENVEGDTITVPLDISDVEELREKWESIVGKEAFDEFEIKVTTDNASVADVQNAFDTMATNYARNMIKIQGATKETMDMVKSQMKLDGLESEGVDKFVDSVVAEDKMQSFVSTLEEAQDAQGNMADGAVAAATDIYEEAKALGITDEMLIDYLKQAALAGNIVLGGDTSWLDLLAEKLGMDIDLLKELLGLANQGSGFVSTTRADGTKSVHSVYGGAEGDAYLKRQEQEAKKRELENKYRNVNYTPSKTDAGKAGGDAGDAYVEAYEKELQQLDDLKSQGLISEREYLDRLKALIDKYFKGRAEYAEKYAQELQKYMDQMLTHYNSVISGATTLLDHRIDQVSKQKETIISSLEEEKEAAEEAYQAQIDAIQEEIDALDDLIEAKQEEIDRLNDQIDAINEANEARDRSINLQKAEYELQRQMHQRTKLVNIYARGYSNVA